MFTGIVRELGRVASVAESASGIRLEIDAPLTAVSTAVGDSVAINGCCLTAVSRTDGRIAFDAVPETLARTSIGALRVAATVNVEPALRVGEPLGGHYVQGHVDGVGRVRAVEDGPEGRRLTVELPTELRRFVVEKGSLTVEGVSLTVAALDGHGFTVALIPHTLAVTTLGGLAPGALVNLEVDVIARYVERLLAQG